MHRLGDREVLEGGFDEAVLLGLEGETPEGVNVDEIARRLQTIRTAHRLRLGGTQELAFERADAAR